MVESSTTGFVQTRVLLVLDQPVIVELVRLTLSHGSYEIRHAVSSADAIQQLTRWSPHLVILNMDLEGVDGARVMDLLGDEKPGGDTISTIAMTRRGDLRTKLAAFDRGVDDILTFPFSPEELLARVIALIRRGRRREPSFTPVIRLGELEIDILQRKVRSGASEIHLTALEQSLLYLLAANAGRIVSRDSILDALWGKDYVVESNVVDRQIRNLRARLQDDWRRPRYIATIPGVGYQFIPTAGTPQER